MKEAEHSYTGPTTSREIPDGVARYLDGTDLLTKTQALRLSTVDPDGWPHAALLSAGDMVMMPSGRIRFALFPKSTVTSNLDREGRLTIALSLDGGICELRLRSRRLAHSTPDVPLAFFEAEVETVRHHVAPYATVTGGVEFSLHEPQFSPSTLAKADHRVARGLKHFKEGRGNDAWRLQGSSRIPVRPRTGGPTASHPRPGSA